jgi:hypothetical protein
VFVTARTTVAHAYLTVPPERNLGRYQWLLECSSVAFSLLDASWEGEARRSTVSDRAKLSNGGPGSSKANVMTLKLVPVMILCSFLAPSGGQGTQSGHAKPPSPAKTEQQPPTVTPPSSGTPAFYSIGFCGRGAAEIVTLGVTRSGTCQAMSMAWRRA